MNNTNDRPLQLYAYIKFMLLMLVFLAAVNAGVYYMDFYAGLFMSLGLVAYAIIILIYYFYRRRKAFQDLVDFATSYSSLANEMMGKFTFPYILVNKSNMVIWANDEFLTLTGLPAGDHRTLGGIIPDMEGLELPSGGESEEVITYKDRVYRVEIRLVTDDNSIDTVDMPDIRPADLSGVYAVSFFDETLYREFRKKYEDERMVPALLYIDNYDEAFEDVDEIKKSILTAEIDTKISDYFGKHAAVLRKFERDKYMLVMQNGSLEDMKEQKFPILQEVRDLKLDGELTVSMSMGIGVNQGSLRSDVDAARVAMDLALGRGGDQVVLRDGESIKYFGGTRMAVEKNTKVKARVKAHALYEILSASESVMIMGHRNPDADSIGSAIGIYCAARATGKRARIVLDKETGAVSSLIDRLHESLEYAADNVFITADQALDLSDKGTVLVIVDTSKADQTCVPELLNRVGEVVVLDHHRMSGSVLTNTSLSYIEPYASSACEMVTEIIQYFPENIKLKSYEADAIYAGIVIDTDNFILKTGVRTFEASAYLRRCGADATRVRKLFRDDFSNFISKNKVISEVSLYRGVFAISKCSSDDALDPTVVGAQAANDLLNIKGVKASFVLTDYNGMIYISARSIDEINVQLIMERLGGGGHMNIAGCQIEEDNIDEAEVRLKELLDEMLDGGDI